MPRFLLISKSISRWQIAFYWNEDPMALFIESFI